MLRMESISPACMLLPEEHPTRVIVRAAAERAAAVRRFRLVVVFMGEPFGAWVVVDWSAWLGGPGLTGQHSRSGPDGLGGALRGWMVPADTLVWGLLLQKRPETIDLGGEGIGCPRGVLNFDEAPEFRNRGGEGCGMVGWKTRAYAIGRIKFDSFER